MKTILKFITLTLLLTIGNLNAKPLSAEMHKSFMKSFKEKYVNKIQKEMQTGYIIDTYKEYTYQKWQNQNWVHELFEIAEIDTSGDFWIWTSTEHSWNNGQWLPEQKYVVTTTPLLGEDPQFINSYSYVYSGGEWIAFSRINYTYEGNNLKEVFLEIAIDINVFFPFQKYIYQYNQYNQLISEIVYNYESEWEPSTKKNLAYDDNGNMVDQLEAIWKEDAWVDTLHSVMTYYQLGLVAVTIDSYFDNRVEVPSRKTEYTYDSFGSVTLIATHLWLEESWMQMQKDHYGYNENSLLETILVEVRFANDFIPSTKYSYSYNSVNQEIEVSQQNYLGGSWSNFKRALTNYTPTSLHEENSVVGNFELHNNYPNPFNPSTKIKFTISNLNQRVGVTLKVFDLLGREVATLVNEELSTGVYEVDFTASPASIGSAFSNNLQSGVYFYQLKAGNLAQTKKMIYLK